MGSSSPKILLIRFSSIGDIVLTTPVIRALHQQLGAEVHLLTKKSFAGVLSENPYLTKIWAIQKHVTEVRAELKQEGYTSIIDLHRNLRSWQVRLALWRTPAYAFNKLNWQKWLLTRWKINRMPDVHIVDRYLDAVAALGIKNDGLGLDYHIPSEDQVDLNQWNISEPFVAVVIGAAHATKRLSTPKLIKLCQQSSQTVALLGGPGDKDAGTEIAQQAGQHVINLCGALKLQQSADVVRQAAVVITHDTGLMHIAAALNKPIISVWGNTVPEFGMYPYLASQNTPSIIAQVDDLPCRPCSKIGSQHCPKGHFKCMQEQDLDRLSRKVELILQRH
ncbi:MAG: glycosyltransferase family 9 protein [Bacteroidota bacterium]